MILGITSSQRPAKGVSPQLYRDTILSLSPMGYWRLGETSGSTATDISGNNRNGTYLGSYTLGQPSMIPSDPDKALGCNGTGYVDVPTANMISAIGKSFIFSIRMTSLTPFSYVWHLGNYGQSGYQGLAFYINTDGTANIEYFDLAYKYVTFSNFTVTINTTYRLSVIFNSATSVSLAVNGVIVDTKSTSGGPFPSVSPLNFRIGSGNNGGGVLRGLQGDADEVAIIPSILSPAQLLSLENAAQ